jgi:hypothetical protein
MPFPQLCTGQVVPPAPLQPGGLECLLICLIFYTKSRNLACKSEQTDLYPPYYALILILHQIFKTTSATALDKTMAESIISHSIIAF